MAVRSSIAHIKSEIAVTIDKLKKGMLAIKNTVMGLGEHEIIFGDYFVKEIHYFPDSFVRDNRGCFDRTRETIFVRYFL